jgi:hypothetical protein
VPLNRALHESFHDHPLLEHLRERTQLDEVEAGLATLLLGESILERLRAEQLLPRGDLLDLFELERSEDELRRRGEEAADAESLEREGETRRTDDARAVAALAEARLRQKAQQMSERLRELPARARAALRAGLAGAVLVAGGLVALTLAVDPVIGLFTTDPEIAAEAARALAILRWALFGIGAWQVLLMTFAALKATGRASALTIAADVAGLGFAALWPGTSSLVAVSLGFCVACWLKAGLLLVLIRVDRAAATRMGHPSR